MATRESITTVGQGARGAPWLSWRGPVGKIVRVLPLVASWPTVWRCRLHARQLVEPYVEYPDCRRSACQFLQKSLRWPSKGKATGLVTGVMFRTDWWSNRFREPWL